MRIAVLGVAILALPGCGGSDSPCVARPGGAPGAVQAPSGCPVSSVIAVDATGAIHDRALAREVSSAALRAAEHTITAGGHLRMVVFAGDADSVEVIYDDDVPTLKQSDETRRGPLEQDLRSAIGATLDGALGVDRSDRALAARVRTLARGGTSDIARAVRNALATLAQGSGARAMTLVSDGAQASDQLQLARRLQAGHSVGRLSHQLGDLLGRADGVDVLQAIGLGRLPGRVNESARRTDQLVQIWKAACEMTGAASCATTTEL
jgi:hypothetical protein